MNMYTKYPRSLHVPWTESMTDDDKILKNMDHFENKEVIVTEKRDGENTSIYSDGKFHARSLNGNNHPSQDWIKNYIQNWFFQIPCGWRVCGENLYATHSIKYSNLTSYFEVFSIWNDNNICLDWDTTVEWCQLLGIVHVPVLYQGIYDEEKIRNISLDKNHQEGYVIRLKESFGYDDFPYSLAKFVRKNHVKEDDRNWRLNWDSRNINRLKEN